MWQPNKLSYDRTLATIAKDIFISRIKEVEFPKEKYYYDRSALLYYIRIVDRDFVLYKLGYTSKTIEERIRTLNFPARYEVSIIETCKFDKAVQAFIVEGLLHREYKKYRYVSDNLILAPGNGNTEIYYKDILQLDDRVGFVSRIKDIYKR